MNKMMIFLCIVCFLISGCSFDLHVLPPAPLATAAPSATQNTPLPATTISATAEAPIPGFTPTTTDPVFYGAYVALDSNGVPGQTRFPAGTKQIFAHWHYQNMHEGLTIKREWYLNEQLWLTREEPWDLSKYGAFGILQDVSIYDFDAGLPSGKYKLSVYIDGIAQPIGEKIIEGAAQSYMEFEILPNIEVTSPNGQWKATSLLGRLVLTDASGSQSDLATGREIVSVAWLDNQRLLFVDRDRSGQVSNLLVGVRDSLWTVDIVSRETKSLYESETALGSTGGLYVSPDGKTVAGVEGTGFGDACFLDSKVIFFQVAGSYESVKVIKQEQFAGIPKTAYGMMYPVSVGSWQGNTQYLVPLNGTCGSFDPALIGTYLFDVPGLKAELQSASATPLSMGDLGWGEVHGVVADAITGMAIPNATVTCAHSSYTSKPPFTCSGSFVTGIPGVFVFQKVFFHDTDTIKLTVTAPGYQPQEFTQSAFTTNDLMVTFSLTPLP